MLHLVTVTALGFTAIVAEWKAVPNYNMASAIAPETQFKAHQKDFSSILKGKLPEKDGIYLYSSAPAPQQIGQEYLVFELHQGQVIGAFYLPYSEFSCFVGRINSHELALTIANAPDLPSDSDTATQQEPRQVAAAGTTPRIGESYHPIAYPYSVTLQDYYQLAEVSASDRQILQTCKDYYSQNH
ncbi:hypothetical protein [Chroococcidiopsis sp. TS-821]|uniref:hypothetical protein n=1 Tax=Chroococcidiopsis sp. TS-821 TaxID=1378066 RepID=UPI000CEDE8C8|nr:hypothetical protein [Chroococcidiopsis sp. TS-821]